MWELFVPARRGRPALSSTRSSTRTAQLLPLKADPVALADRIAARHGVARRRRRRRSRGPTRPGCSDRAARHAPDAPIAIYEVHAGSWLRDMEHERPQLRLERASAERLIPYAKSMGFTHLEFLPVMEHPFGGSWGYQPLGLFAPTARFGTPDDFARFVDRCHEAGIGVILDWVPAHFPNDAHGLVALRRQRAVRARRPARRLPPGLEHADLQLRPQRGARLPDRVGARMARALSTSTACASTRSRRCCIATTAASTASGSRTSTAAARTSRRSRSCKELNTVVAERCPGAMTIAEESTAWPGVTAPVADGGLGFYYKWNMGWMHDTLRYIEEDPINRQLASRRHDVRHGVRVLREVRAADLARRGRARQGFADQQDAGRRLAEAREPARLSRRSCGRIRARSCCSWAARSADYKEWNHDASPDWHLLDDAASSRLQRLRARPQPPVRGDGRRCTSWTAIRRASRGSSATTARNSVFAFRRSGRDASRRRDRGRQHDAGGAQRLPDRRAARRAPGASASTATPPTTAARASAISGMVHAERRAASHGMPASVVADAAAARPLLILERGSS